MPVVRSMKKWLFYNPDQPPGPARRPPGATAGGGGVEAVAAGPPVRGLVEDLPGRHPAAVLALDVHGDAVVVALLVEAEHGVVHAERAGDAFGDDDVERFPGDGFDDAAEPVDVDAVDEAAARVGDHRCLEGLGGSGHHVGDAGDLLVAGEGGGPEPIAKPGGVR